MSSLKTVYFTMNKWEGTDRVERLEFNENFDIIDSKLKDLVDTKLSLTGGTILGDLTLSEGTHSRFYGINTFNVGTANDVSDTEGIIRFASDGVESTGGAYIQYAPPTSANTVNNSVNQLTISSYDSLPLDKLRIVAKSLVVSKNGTYNEILAKNELNKTAYEDKNTVSNFHGYKSANTLVANATYNQLGFDRIVYDNKTEFDLAQAGKFVAKEDGTYLFHASINHLSMPQGSEYRLAFYVDGVMSRLLQDNYAPVAGNLVSAGSSQFRLSAGQTVHVVYWLSASASTTISIDRNYTYFTGVRLH